MYFLCVGLFVFVEDTLLKMVHFLGDGNEGLHKQRIQTRKGQFYLPVQGGFGIIVHFVNPLFNNFIVQGRFWSSLQIHSELTSPYSASYHLRGCPIRVHISRIGGRGLPKRLQYCIFKYSLFSTKKCPHFQNLERSDTKKWLNEVMEVLFR